MSTATAPARIDTTKTCCVCGVNRTRSQFHRNRANPDGLQAHCKLCIRAYKRGYEAGLRRAGRIAA